MAGADPPRGDPSPQLLDDAAAIFGLLATPMRLHMVWVLAQGECDVTRLADRVGGALPAVSQHLSRLKLAGLVHSRRQGRRQLYLVDDPRVIEMVRLIFAPVGAPRAAEGHARGWPR